MILLPIMLLREQIYTSLTLIKEYVEIFLKHNLHSQFSFKILHKLWLSLLARILMSIQSRFLNSFTALRQLRNKYKYYDPHDKRASPETRNIESAYA